MKKGMKTGCKRDEKTEGEREEGGMTWNKRSTRDEEKRDGERSTRDMEEEDDLDDGRTNILRMTVDTRQPAQIEGNDIQTK